MLIYKCKLKRLILRKVKKVLKMTKVEMYTKIMTLVEDVEVKDFCESEIAKIKASNDRKKSATSEKRKAENEPILKAIREFLTDKDWVLASDIAKGVGQTTQKINGIIKQIDNIEVTDVKVPKVGVRKAYRLAE